jgi:hypothetical protein
MGHTQPFTPQAENSTAVAAHPIGSPRHFVLACIGLLSLLADEIPALMEQSVQRGATVVERAQTEARRRRNSPQIDDNVPREWSRQGLPTHADFEMLLQQVADLERQIDQIAAQRAARQ